MIIGAPIVGASLIALLIDRFVIERRIGATPFSAPSTKFSTTVGSALPVLITLIISSAASGAITVYALQPLGAAYLQPIVFAALIVAISLGGEILLPQWQTQEMRNRVFGRTTVITAILGFLILLPQSRSTGPDKLSLAWSILNAAIAGITFFFVVLIWNGIHEKLYLARGPNERATLAKELVTASLIALVLLSISSLNVLHR
jgi:Na+-translocating ferredoxin:NAD+ oxidoreductase RnfA subunit